MGKAFIIHGKAKQAVEIITDLLATPGTISIEHSAIKAIVGQEGNVLICIGSGAGKDRVIEACQDALNNSRKEADIKQATKVLVNITGPTDLLLKEVNDGLDIVKESVSPTAEIIFGVTRGGTLHNQAKVTLVAVT